MKNSFWDKRIPTLFGFFLIAVGIAATSYLVQIGFFPFINAAPTENPDGLRITNITDTSFTVTYKTNAQVIGSINIGKDTNLGQVVLDDRDEPTGIPKQYNTHSITVRNLQPNTKYYFSITSGKTTFLNNSIPFTVTTGPPLSGQPTSEEPLAGKIILPNGDTPEEAIVYVTSSNGQTLSTLVKSTGVYIIPLNTIRTTDLSSFMTFNSDSILQMLIRSSTFESRVILFADKRNPMPTITLSNNYDFTLNTTPLASSSALPVGFPSFSLNTTVTVTPQIITPQKDEKFTDSQPLFKGQALPNEEVQITIHSSDASTATVTADSLGNWFFRPSSKLSPGQHTITITTKDQFGILKTIQQTFTIFASGTQVAEAATPSATLTPSQTPTSIPTNTPAPTITPTSVPTGTLSPSPLTTQLPTPSVVTTITSVPTATLSVTRVPTKPLPPTGNNAVVAAGIGGLVTTTVGVILFLITRGISL